MGFMHIENLYKEQEILLFRECYALEKIHGSSAWIKYKHDHPIIYYAGGQMKDEPFQAMFDRELVIDNCRGTEEFNIFGEVYGGKIMGMSGTYGKVSKWIGFDVQINGLWLAVPQAEEIIKNLGLEFVHYEKISTDLEEINRMRDMQSVQAIRNGMGEGKKREGTVLRPLIELRKNNDSRIISKHKNDDYKETKTPREVTPEQLKVLSDAQAIADEWVVLERVRHVLDKVPDAGMTKMKEIIIAMQEDIKREAEGEIVWSQAVAKAIGKATATAVKLYYTSKIGS